MGRIGWLPYLAPVLVLQFIFLSPSMQTGWLADDSLNHNIRPSLEYQGLSFWEHSERDITAWWAAGRFFPLLSYQGYGTFYWFQDVETYKVWILLLTAVAGAAIFALLRNLGVGRAASALAVLIASVTIQFRDFHDPILSYQGFIQLLIAGVALSLLCLDRFLTRRRWGYLAASTLLYAAACALYEASYVLVLLHAVLTLGRSASWRFRLLALMPPALVAFSFIGLGVFLRSATENTTHGYQASLDLGAARETFFEQVLAALPTSFRLASDYPELESLASLSESLSPTALALTIAAGLLAAIFTYLSSTQVIPRRTAVCAVLLGLAFVLAPAVPISLAAKYQIELKPGWGHLPVLMQIFGFGMTVAVIAATLSRWVRRIHIAAVLALSLVVGGSVSYVTAFDRVSNEVVAERATEYRHLMEAQAAALSNGAVSAAAPGSRIYVDGSSWLWPYFFYRYTGVKYEVQPVSVPAYATEPRDPSACSRDPKAVYRYEDDGNVANGMVGVTLTCVGPLR